MNSVFKPLVSVPVPSQVRSQEALDRFLAAGEALLADNQFEDAGVAEIARKADSSVGTFYRLLGDKETLSLLLLQRFFFSIEQLVDEHLAPERWQDQSVVDIAEHFVAVFAQAYQGRRGVLRALILRASRDRDFRDRVHDLNDHIAGKTAAILKAHLSEIHHPKPRKAIVAVVHIVLGALNQHTVTGSLGGLSQRELSEEMTRVFLSYLGVCR